MVSIILYCIGGYYLLSLIIQLTRLALRWWQASHSPDVRFGLVVFTDDVPDDPYRYIAVTPWFYEETERSFTIAFALRGFSIFFIPAGTMGMSIRGLASDFLCWQVMFDSINQVDSGRGPIPCDSGEQGTGFSGGDDILFMKRDGLTDEVLHAFREAARGVRIPLQLLEVVKHSLQPDVVVFKEGNRWVIGFRETDSRTEFLGTLLHTIGEKVLRKHGVTGAVLSIEDDAARRFISRGQVSWWLKGSVDGDNVVFQGDGIRPNEATSADWALVSIPFTRAS